MNYITRGKNEGDTTQVWQGKPDRLERGNDVHFYGNENSVCLCTVSDVRAFSRKAGIGLPEPDSCIGLRPFEF